MTEERIDIVLTDKVSDEPARKIQFLATQARDANSALVKLREQLTQINASSVKKLQETMTDSVTQTTRQATALERLEASQLRTATAAERLSTAQARTNEAVLQGSLAEQRLTTESERTERATLATALAKEKLETASRRNAAATQQDGDAAVKLYQKNEALIEQARRSQAASGAQAQYNTTLGVTAGTSGAARASMGVFAQDAREKEAAATATADLERRTIALKSAIDPAYASQLLYNRSVGEASALLKAGTITQDDHAKAVGLASAALAAHGGVQKKAADLTKLTTFQMLTLQYTMNDVAASLASGASPFTILTQQGGQVTQAWGGLFNTLRALGGFLMTPIGLIGTAAIAVAGFVYAVAKGSAETAAFNKVLLLSGNIAGTTTAQMWAMAQSIAGVTNASVGAAGDAVRQFVSSGQFAASAIEGFAATAVSMQRLTGVAVADTIKQFVELGKEPVDASVKLNATTGYLTISVYEQIRALMQQGKALEAGTLAQQAYADAMTSRVPALKDNLGAIERALKSVITAGKGMWDAILNIGRATDPLAAAQKAVADREALMGVAVTGAGTVSQDDTVLNRLKQELVYQQHIADSQRDYAASQAASQAQLKNVAAFDKLHDQFLSKAAQKQQAINVATVAYHRDGVFGAPGEAQKFLETLAGIEKKYKEVAVAAKTPKDAWSSDMLKDYSNAMDALGKEQVKASAGADKLSKTQEILRGIMAQPTWAAFSHQQQEQVIMAASLSQAAEDEANATSMATIATKEREKEIAKLLDTGRKEIDQLDVKIKKQTEANAQIGMTKEQVDILRISRDMDAASSDAQLAANLRTAAAFAGPLHDAYLQYADDLDAAAKRKRTLAGLDYQAAELQNKLGISNTVEHDLKRAITAAFSGSGNPIQAFGNALGKAVETSVVDSIAKAMTNALVGSSIGTGILSFFGAANGAAFSANDAYFGNGGTFTNTIVDSPTAFRFAAGGDFRTGIMGEAGPEAVMPLSRGSDGKLGVKASGTAVTNVINININATVGDIASKSDVVAGMRATANKITSDLARQRRYGGAA